MAIFMSVLADRTAARGMVGYCHDTVVCLSVCPSVFDAVYCGSQGRDRGLKVVLSYSLDVSFSHKTQRTAKKADSIKNRFRFETLNK